MRFNGSDYDQKRDGDRLTQQHERIAALMSDGEWRTVADISMWIGAPENSVQAQLRHLRKPRFGAFIVSKERGENSLYRYHVRERRLDDPPYQGGKSIKGVQSELEAALRVVAKMKGKIEALDDVKERFSKWLVQNDCVKESLHLDRLFSEIMDS